MQIIIRFRGPSIQLLNEFNGEKMHKNTQSVRKLKVGGRNGQNLGASRLEGEISGAKGEDWGVEISGQSAKLEVSGSKHKGRSEPKSAS